MSRIKKIITVIVIALFIAALSINIGILKPADAHFDPCPGIDPDTYYDMWIEEWNDCMAVINICRPLCI